MSLSSYELDEEGYILVDFKKKDFRLEDEETNYLDKLENLLDSLIPKKDRNVHRDYIVEPPSQEWIQALETKMFWRPDHVQANKILEHIVPDTHIIAHPEDYNELSNLLKLNIIFLHFSQPSTVKFRKMKISMCHQNSAALLKKGKIDKMYTGWGLSPDGVWRHHSWGVFVSGGDEVVIETTEKRVVYLGVTSWIYFKRSCVVAHER